MKRFLKYGLLLLLILLSGSSLHAQLQGLTPRQQMDQELQGLNFADVKALLKSKEFIRRDSTYYLGWFLEGAFKYFRATDAIGFRNAINSLEHALRLVEKDYRSQLRTRATDIVTYFKVAQYQHDHNYIVQFLEHCYQNIERPDLAVDLIRKSIHKNIQTEFGVTAYNDLAWIYHRNRVYTSANYSFLKQSVAENNQAAALCLDSAARKYRRDYYGNVQLFQPSYVQEMRYEIYFNKIILYVYDLQVDSAEYYFNLLKPTRHFSPNNYANFKHALGDFRAAEEYYQKAAQEEDKTVKRTREFNYMLGMIDIYKGQPEMGDSLLKGVIDAQGSSPGFGWHTIGLAREKNYEGLTAESQHEIDKARAFHELHIGSTWGPEQYNLCIAFYNFQNKRNQIREFEFENNSWWHYFSPSYWIRYLTLKAEEQDLRLIVATLLANNPERADVVYQIFSTENLLSFDEVWFLVQDFSNEYFLNYYKKKLEGEKREKVKKYYRYMIAKFLYNEGETKEAIANFNEVLHDVTMDNEYDRLLLARTYEGLSLALADDGQKVEAGKMAVRFYETYPQLVPFSKVKMPMRVSLKGDPNDPVFKAISESFMNCNIAITDDKNAPEAQIEYRVEGKKKQIHYGVYSQNNNLLVPESVVNVKNGEEAGRILAYRLFKVEKKSIDDKRKS